MSIQTIPLAAIQKIRQYIQNILVLPESEQNPKAWVSFEAVDELPEPESLDQLGDLFNFASPQDDDTPAPNLEGRWFVSSVNPGAALVKLPGLQLKSGFRLASYLYRQQENGVGIIWALPEEFCSTAELEEALVKSDERTPPHPLEALPDCMAALEGDRSPASFAIASLLRRELQEFGRAGKYANWSHHRLINAPPPQAQWQWNIPVPKDLSPKVKIFPDGKVAVEFFSCRVVNPVAIFRHLDQYPVGSYQPQCTDKAIAIPQRKAPSQ